MTRGKYADRAVNRDAVRGNILLAEKTRQVEALTAKVAELERTLTAERRDRGSEVVRRADTLSAEQVQVIRSEMSELTRNYVEEKKAIAEAFTDWFRTDGRFPNFWADGILPILVPDTQERSQYIVDTIAAQDSTRGERRHAAKLYEHVVRARERRQLSGMAGRTKLGKSGDPWSASQRGEGSDE